MKHHNLSKPDSPDTERRRSQILGMIIIAILVLLIASIRFYFKLA